MTNNFSLFRTFAALAVISFSLHGQVTGRIIGTVVDPSGSSVPNATVSLYLSGGTKAALTTRTTSAGDFGFAAVRPETYRLTVESPGFATSTVNSVSVDLNR